MKIQLKKFSSLNSEEMIFIYSMLRKYGEMEEAKERVFSKKKTKNRYKPNNNKPKPRVRKDSQYPDLYDFSDPKWKDYNDKKFLAYREIMERIGD